MSVQNAVVVWGSGPVDGTIHVVYGALAGNSSFSLPGAGPCRLPIEIAEGNVDPGGKATRITIRTKERDFTFFLRDAGEKHPIFLPQYGLAVTTVEDTRTYDEIAESIRRRKLKSCLDTIESEPEESYDRAARRVRSLECPTWLGVSRDMRIFEIAPYRPGGYWGWIKPRFHSTNVTLAANGEEHGVCLDFALGRGCGAEIDVSRRLDNGCLPILRGKGADGDIAYDLTAFVTMEKTPLRKGSLRGTHFLVADGHADGHSFTDAQKNEFDRLLPSEMERDEETVLHMRVAAKNTGKTPAYAWFRTPVLNRQLLPAHGYDEDMGFSLFGPDRVYCISKLNGLPAKEQESAVLIQPGEDTVVEFIVPHRPIPPLRAQALTEAKFDKRLRECRAFWKKKLSDAATIELPERRIDEMVRAGLLHLDLVNYGLEPDGTLAPVVGIYAPIGSESIGIVRFFEFMGRHDLARRAIQYFFDKQHENGFIQNFNDYTLETGGALSMIGEHYLYTRDLDWVKSIAPGALKSCEFILEWHRRNKRDELRGRGYGMIDGKVADPNDPTRYFMNSALAYLGLKRSVEWLREIDSDRAEEIAREAEEFRLYIRAALAECIARSPVVPMGDGTWVQTAPAWAEATGPQMIFCEGEPCFSHSTFTCRDSLIGPLWLVFGEVLEPDEHMTDVLLKSHAALMTIHNVPFSEPYYCRSDYAHLTRGDVKAFLKRYYNGFAALADRETYSFWEHLYHVSPHKVSEEGWFLMETRWMLAMEDGDDLRLLGGIPRAWLANGKRIALENVATHFGSVSLTVESNVGENIITARYAFPSDRRPKRLFLRLPHPNGPRPGETTVGTYDARTETVEIVGPTAGEVQLRFEKGAKPSLLPTGAPR